MAPAQKNVPLTFPTLTVGEIVYDLSQLGVNVSEVDLLRPSPGGVQVLWPQVIEALSGSPPQLDAVHKEGFSGSLPIILLRKYCDQFMRKCGIEGFRFGDLVQPDKDRLVFLLSGVINFARFCGGNQELPQELQARASKTREEKVKLRKELHQIEASIIELEAKNAEEQPKAQLVAEKNQQLVQELVGRNTELLSLSDVVKSLKEKRTALALEAEEMHKEIKQTEQTTRDVRARIMRSPERVRGRILELQHAVANDRETLKSLDNKLHDFGKRLDMFESLQVDLRNLITLERDIEAQQTGVDQLRAESAELRETVEKAKIEFKSQGHRVELLANHIAKAEERLHQLRTNITQHRDRAEKKIESLKTDYVEKSVSRQAQRKQKERLAHERLAIENQRKALTESNEEELREVMREYWQLRQSSEDYMKTLVEQLGLREYGLV